MIKTYKIAVIIILLLGLIHVALGFWLYPSFDKEFFWFEGTGLALIYTFIINYINLIVKSLRASYWQNKIYRLTQLANILTLIFGLVIAIKFTHIPGALVAINSILLLIFARSNN